MSGEAAILLDILILLVVAKALEEIVIRLGQPPLLGDLLAGIILGPTLLDLVEPHHGIATFAWIGIVILIFLAGMDSSISELKRYGKGSMLVAMGGVAATTLLAFTVGYLLGYGFNESLFMAVILAPTSVGVSVAVLAELGLLRVRVGEIVVGAAVADDVIAMVLFSIVYSVIAEERLGVERLGMILAGLGFIAAAFYLIHRYSSRIVDAIVRGAKEEATPEIELLIIGVAVATATSYFNLSPLIGAYFAGLGFAEALRGYGFRERFTLLLNFATPFFFIYAGLLLDPWAALSSIEPGRALVTASSIVAAGMAGKVLGCGLMARRAGLPWREAWIIGFSMMPRAGVDLVIAVSGLQSGIIGMDIYLSALLLIYTTSLSTPVIVQLLAGKRVKIG